MRNSHFLDEQPEARRGKSDLSEVPRLVRGGGNPGTPKSVLCPCVTLCRSPLCRGSPSSVALAFSLLTALLQTFAASQADSARRKGQLPPQLPVHRLYVGGLGTRSLGPRIVASWELRRTSRNRRKRHTKEGCRFCGRKAGRKAPNALGLLSVGLGRAFLWP